MDRLKEFAQSLLSRKFILSVVAAFVAFGNEMWGWGLSFEEVLTIIAPLLAYIGVEGYADARERGN